MVLLISQRITEHLIVQGAVCPEEREVYVYGFDHLIASSVQVICLAGVAALLWRWWEVLLFSFSFTLLKRRAGGFHLSGHLGCIALFTACAALGVLASQITVLFLCLLPAVIVVVLLLAPVADAHNPKSREEMKRCVHVCRAVLAGEVLALLCLYEFAPVYATAGVLGMSVAAVSLLIPVKERGEKG